ncbi:AraC family transcriptional regulator [Mesorhizobium sp.]|uniref:helix-turn-helix domain-containing protein n=1 Tax=Mesorhizobium sp. TaxID=1871066 RepID=UPI0025C3934B|nr:AraC family transcriptional regulator [Mesorhizobium sp.]
MSKDPPPSNRNMDYLRVKSAKTIESSVLDKGTVTATRLTRGSPGHGYVRQAVIEDAFMISVQLRDYRGQLWIDGRWIDFPIGRAGNFTLYDHKRETEADLQTAFDCINLYIPRPALDALQEDLGSGQIGTLNVAPGADTDDPVVRGLAHALIPAFEQPAQTSRLFLDHMGLALTSHMAIEYGEADASRLHHSGVLAPWQLRRAMELVDAHSNGNVTLVELAGACGLSVSYFTRSFKRTTGMTPHRWLQKRNIEKVKDRMRKSGASLAEISIACGFADQSHMTRVFRRLIGTTPAGWRRQIGG